MSKTTPGGLNYLDLYSGPGVYEDGAPSTPLLVLGACARNQILSERVRIVFNDVKTDHTNKLSQLISDGSFDKRLRVKPTVHRSEVDILLAKQLDQMNLAPTFCFVDPYGFKGLSRQLVHAVLKDRGSDCLIFLHTSGINRNLFEDESMEDLQLLFGSDQFSELRASAKAREASREELVLQFFCRAATEEGAKHVLPLRFNFPCSRRVSHHLVFLTKHTLGFHIMKEVMSGFSATTDGIPDYVYTEGLEESSHDLTLGLVGPTEDLEQALTRLISDATITVGALVQKYDDSDGPATEKNIKAALLQLEAKDRIVVTAAAGVKRRKNTMADHLQVKRKSKA